MGRTISNKTLLQILLAAVPLIAACAAMPAADTGGPRVNQPDYPILLAGDPQRDQATLAAARQILGSAASPATDVALEPITGTIHRLPANPVTSVFLPKLGTEAEMTEEETREALRRFIVEWQNIIGADPADLSLVSRTDEPDGTKLAKYEQRPFRYPLRGEYGQLQIRFTKDRRVLDIISTCIPDADRLQPTIAAINPTVKPEDAIRLVSETGVSYTSTGGQSQLIKPAANDVDTRELVVYVTPSTSRDALQFRLCWEVSVKNAPFKTVYIDAVNSQVVAVA